MKKFLKNIVKLKKISTIKDFRLGTFPSISNLGIKQQSIELAGNNDFFSSLTRTCFPTCNMHKTTENIC